MADPPPPGAQPPPGMMGAMRGDSPLVQTALEVAERFHPTITFAEVEAIIDAYKDAGAAKGWHFVETIHAKKWIK